MAITKLLRIKEAPAGKPSSGLLACLRYIANPDKTENCLLTGGSCGGDPDLTYSDMVSNKKSWIQTDGTQGFHYILSFPPTEDIAPDTLRAITEEFCKELLKGDFLYAYAIHNDREHLHSHICFDSVSLSNGHKFHSGQYDWLARIQPITDRLCKKHGMPALDFDPANRSERKTKYHEEWERENIFKVHKKTTWTDIIRGDVDIALSKSHTWDDFVQTLRDMRYEIRDGRHLSLRPEGKERFTRSGRLGEAYSKERLQARLGEPLKQTPAFGDAEPMLRALREYLQRTRLAEITGVKVVFYRRWYAYSYVNRSRTPWKYRKDLTELGKYTDRCTYLFQHDISFADDLQNHLRGLQEERDRVKHELTRVQNQLYNTPLASWRKLERLRSKLDSVSEVERPAIQAQISMLVQSLTDQDMVAGAEKYRELLERKQDLQTQQKALNAELKMASDLVSDFARSGEPGDILQDPDRYTPPAFTDNSYHRITINNSLFRDTSDDSDFLQFRIPGSNESLLIYKADTRMAADGSFASAYIYDHLAYRILDRFDHAVRMIPGKEVLDYFTDRTREKAR